MKQFANVCFYDPCVGSVLHKQTHTGPRTHTRKSYFQYPRVQKIGKLVKQNSARSENILFFLLKTIYFQNLLFLNIVAKCSSNKEGGVGVFSSCSWNMQMVALSTTNIRQSPKVHPCFYLQTIDVTSLFSNLATKMPRLVSNFSFFALSGFLPS